jgi:oligopeptide/dipeptide ABC transporter ATP-binding protein
MTPILELKGIGKRYPLRGHSAMGKGDHGLRALDDVSLQVERGEIVGCMGESGCGKSTLARVAIRLEEPTVGQAFFEGEDIHRLNGERLRRYRQRVQMVFQDPYSALAPRMSVGNAIEEPLRIFKIGDGASRRRRVAELLDLVGLAVAMADRYPHQLSGGQRQRVNIARALALDPELLILDEPVSALDVSVQAQVINLLRDLQTRLGLTYFFISHDLRVVKYLCDRVAVMYLGRIVEVGPTEEVFSRPKHPYTLALLHSIPDHGGALLTNRQAVLRGEVPSPVDLPSGCAFHPRCPMAQAICRTERPQLETVGGMNGTNWCSACHFADKVTLDAFIGATDEIEARV